ncbi:MAG: macro domain-containing protein [Polyangiaceae bacterium]
MVITMLPTRILLRDHSEKLVAAWNETFANHDAVEALVTDFFDEDADALVSPANSFGIMDGGLDRAIRDRLGHDVEKLVQRRILEDHHGEIPIGAAFVVATQHARWPYLIVAPTMRVPEPSGHTLNAYLAFRAILLAVRAFNETCGSTAIGSVVVPGLCTGIGGMEPRRCAAQMRLAYDQITKPARIPSFNLIHELHRKLRSAG